VAKRNVLPQKITIEHMEKVSGELPNSWWIQK
jgi:hypothetical protein